MTILYLLAKFGFDTAENEFCKVYPLSVYRSPRLALHADRIELSLRQLTALGTGDSLRSLSRNSGVAAKVSSGSGDSALTSAGVDLWFAQNDELMKVRRIY